MESGPLDARVQWKASTSSPAEIVAEVESRAERIDTPFEGGTIAWRCFGAGRPLALLHGGFGSWTHWIRNVEALGRHYRVLAADMAGYGDSSDAPAPTAEAIAEALAPGLRQLAGGEPVTLAGFSFGGIVCGLIAQQGRVPIRAVVLVGAACLGLQREPMDLRAWRNLVTPEARREAHRANVATLMIWDKAKIDPLAVHLQQQNAERARFRSRRIARTSLLRTALEATNVPLAGIWGEYDATAAPYVEERRELLQRLRPGAPFEVIPGAGHWVQYEAPDRFNATLLRMLEEVKPRA